MNDVTHRQLSLWHTSLSQTGSHLGGGKLNEWGREGHGGATHANQAAAPPAAIGGRVVDLRGRGWFLIMPPPAPTHTHFPTCDHTRVGWRVLYLYAGHAGGPRPGVWGHARLVTSCRRAWLSCSPLPALHCIAYHSTMNSQSRVWGQLRVASRPPHKRPHG